MNKVLSIPCVLIYYNASCMKYGTLYGNLSCKFTLCHAIYVNDIIYCIARNFRGRHKFRGFVATCESFLHKILGCGILWYSKSQ